MYEVKQNDACMSMQAECVCFGGVGVRSTLISKKFEIFWVFI